MDFLYISFLFLSLLGGFICFVWVIVKAGNEVAYEITLEPQLKESSFWKSNHLFSRNDHFSQSPGGLNIKRYYSASINEEEARLMNEIDNIKDKKELREWFGLLKSGYKHKNIPKKVYLRVSTLLNGYMWFDDTEYLHRLQEGKPVHKVTEREYILEKKLESLIDNGSQGKTA